MCTGDFLYVNFQLLRSYTMRTFTRLVGIAFLLFISFVSAAQAEETPAAQKAYTCEPSKEEPNLRKVCTDKSVQTYLLENFFQPVGNNPELADVICDWSLSISPKGFFSNGPNYGTICQNKSDNYRILIGWDGNAKYVTTIQELGNMQLYLRGKDDAGRLKCSESDIYKKIQNAVAAGSCTMTITDGQNKGDSISSVIVFLKPEKASGRRFYIAVMNINKSTSVSDIESFMLKGTLP